MVEVPEKLDLAERSEAEHAMVERGDALYGDLALRGLVDGRAFVHDCSSELSGGAEQDEWNVPDNAICTFAYKNI